MKYFYVASVVKFSPNPVLDEKHLHETKLSVITRITTQESYRLIHLVLTFCGLTGQKTLREGLGLGGSVHEEAPPCFPYFAQTTLKSIDAGSTNCQLIKLIPSVDYSIREYMRTAVTCTPKFN